MPDSRKVTSPVLPCLFFLGLSLVAVVSAGTFGDSFISSTTSVSGQVIVNDTATIRTISYTGGVPAKQEWNFATTFETTYPRSWTSTLSIRPEENTLKISYFRTGAFFSPFHLSF
ncbi:MAG: hypothetical protein NQU46_08915 [Methanolinea sp.]|nr:hypothetical protein [Methanolinea sp.]